LKSNPIISNRQLIEIINDSAPLSATLRRVGIVGSYARGSETNDSDVDLVFDVNGVLIDEAVLSAGLKIKSILGNQFQKEIDIINYDTILNRTNGENSGLHALEIEGYMKMRDEIRWLWRKGQ